MLAVGMMYAVRRNMDVVMAYERKSWQPRAGTAVVNMEGREVLSHAALYLCHKAESIY